MTERIDIKEDHNNPKVVFTDTRYTDDETDEDEEYQDPLINLEETDEMISKHDTDNDEMYHDTLETIKNPKNLVINRETA